MENLSNTEIKNLFESGSTCGNLVESLEQINLSKLRNLEELDFHTEQRIQQMINSLDGAISLCQKN